MKCGRVGGSYYWLAVCNQSYVKYKNCYIQDVKHNIEKVNIITDAHEVN